MAGLTTNTSLLHSLHTQYNYVFNDLRDPRYHSGEIDILSNSIEIQAQNNTTIKNNNIAAILSVSVIISQLLYVMISK